MRPSTRQRNHPQQLGAEVPRLRKKCPGLISSVGEDCAGAVQFVQPERLDAILGAAAPPIEWLDEAAIAGRLRALRQDQSAWRIPRDTGQFSLAGAQPKTEGTD